MTTYSFRAENVSDVSVFMAHCRTNTLLTHPVTTYVDPQVLEPLVEFVSHATYEELLEVMRRVTDGHVMIQTFEPAPLAQNPCKRDYSRI